MIKSKEIDRIAVDLGAGNELIGEADQIRLIRPNNST